MCVSHTVLSFVDMFLLNILPQFAMPMISLRLKLLECKRVVCQLITQLQIPLGMNIRVLVN